MKFAFRTFGRLSEWGLSAECGYPGELVAMLELLDAWECSVGADRMAVAAQMLEFVPEVAAAGRYLAAGDIRR